MSKKTKIGIYIHVPFCKSKCPYCDFFSVAVTDDLLDKYVQKTCDCLKYWSKINRVANSLYFGGGTPSLLGTKRIKTIVECVDKYFNVLNNNSEITLEMNPGDYKSLDFSELYNSGINRISIGLQSSNDNELNLLGRRHTSETCKEAVYTIQNAGFKNISLDLMIATPLQTQKSLSESIRFCSELQVQHVSAYILKIEEGTSFYHNKAFLNLPDEEVTSDLYLIACDELEKFGFKQYEISNFCKTSYESQHNLKYWNAQEYLGIGPSSHSFIDGKRFFYERSINNFFQNQNIIFDGSGGYEEEYVMLRLRLSQGLINADFKKRFGKNISKKYFQNALKLKNSDLLFVDEDCIRFTPKGFLVSNKLTGFLLN